VTSADVSDSDYARVVIETTQQTHERVARSSALHDARVAVQRYVMRNESALSLDTHYHLDELVAMLGRLR